MFIADTFRIFEMYYVLCYLGLLQESLDDGISKIIPIYLNITRNHCNIQLTTNRKEYSKND